MPVQPAVWATVVVELVKLSSPPRIIIILLIGTPHYSDDRVEIIKPEPCIKTRWTLSSVGLLVGLLVGPLVGPV